MKRTWMRTPPRAPTDTFCWSFCPLIFQSVSFIVGPFCVSLSSFFFVDPCAHRHCTSLRHKQNRENPRDSQCMKKLSSKWLMYSGPFPQRMCPILTEQNGESPCQSMTQNSVTQFSHYLNDTSNKTTLYPPLYRAIVLNCENDPCVGGPKWSCV